MDEKGKSERIQIYSYSKVWNIEHRIYSIGNINLPVPVQPYNALYFVLSCGFVVALCRLLPIISLLPGVIRYFVFPYAITVFLRKKKLDGKNPIKYFIAYIKYQLFERGRYFEHFKSFSDRATTYQLKWICSVKYHKR